MTFEAGVYIVRNAKSNTVIDLSGGDRKSLMGYSHHGMENQQWEFGPLGDGWCIRSLRNGGYFTLEKGMHDGALLTTNSYPVAWAIEPMDKPNEFR